MDPGGDRLFLNQTIEITFNRPVDPLSVTEDTVRVVDEAGGLVAVRRRRVRSFSVMIEPRVPTDPDLSNGSYFPGKRYSLVLPGYPRNNSVRGIRGEILQEGKRESWTALDPKTLPADVPTPFLPFMPFARLQLVALPVVAPDGSWIELAFNRPVFPPTAVPSAFVLKRADRRDDLPFAAVHVLRRDVRAGVGSILRLEPGRPLTPGRYELYFPPGYRALRDYRLEPAWIRPDAGDTNRTIFYPELGRNFLPIQVVRGRTAALLVEDFRTPRSALDGDPSGSSGFPDRVEGALDWGPDGLRLPRLGFDGFDPLGTLQPMPGTRDLQPNAVREIASDTTVKLPADVWDFTSVRLPEGLFYVVLDPQRTLRIRVAGAFEVAGDLVFRVQGPRLTRARATTGPTQGDPRESWRQTPGRVEIEIGGIARLTGRILRQDGNAGPTTGLVPGFLWGRGPFFGDWSRCALEVWRWPRSHAPAAGPTVALPGLWAAISGWYPVPRSAELLGVIERTNSEPGIEVFVQARGENGVRHAWSKELPQGLLDAVRFGVCVRGRRDTGEVLLEALRIR